MQQLIIVLHILVALALMGLVLIQHGKGADVGASFGSGAANTMFGSVGPASFLMKLTGVFAMVFFATSIALAYLGSMQQPKMSPLNAPVHPVAPTPATSSPENSFAPSQPVGKTNNSQ